MDCGYSFLVHIKRNDGFRPISHFFERRVFYHGEKFVQKFGLDKAVVPGKKIPFKGRGGGVSVRKRIGEIF